MKEIKKIPFECLELFKTTQIKEDITELVHWIHIIKLSLK